MESLQQIAGFIKENDNYLILGHVDPDGDCFGSVFALKRILDEMGKQSLILLEEELPEQYSFFEVEEGEYCLFKDYENYQPQWLPQYYIALDAGDKARLGPGENIVVNNRLINVDHHQDNPHYGKYNYVNPEMAAVGEIIFELAGFLKVPVDKKIGTPLLTAILADTGGFRYQNTSPHVYRIAASLTEIGVDNYQINRALYASNTFEEMKLRGLVLNTLKLTEDGKIAWLKVKEKDLEKSGVDVRASSGLVNYARDIRGVEVGIAFIEEEDYIRVSLRSNDYCPVQEIASFFGGGGHPRAAGCKIDDALENAVKKVINRVKEYV